MLRCHCNGQFFAIRWLLSDILGVVRKSLLPFQVMGRGTM